jgi:6-phosphofructokinase 1
MSEETKKIHRIGILTSGGDAPGMNAVIRAVTRMSIANGIEVLGILHGYAGLISSDFKALTARDVDGLLSKGGTMLYTARCEEMFQPEYRQRAADNCRFLGIDGLICCGGDGTFRGAQELCRLGVPCVCITGTIDNDIACTDYTIGFDTACNTAIEAIDKLRDTMQSHARCSVVEVMGRRAGHLALAVGASVGAAAILVPEESGDFETNVIEKIRMGRINGRNHHIIIVAEGYSMTCQEVADKIIDETGVDTRITILGHVQRGGAPSSQDRLMATKMGIAAVEALMAGKTQRIIVERDNKVIDIDIEEGLNAQKSLDMDLLQHCRMMSI